MAMKTQRELAGMCATVSLWFPDAPEDGSYLLSLWFQAAAGFARQVVGDI